MSTIPATTTTGTLVDGVVKLDKSVDLPNNSRVRVSIEAITSEQDRDVAQSAVRDYLNYLEINPINSGGLRFSRDELNERD